MKKALKEKLKAKKESHPNQLIFKINASIEASGVFEARKTF